MTDRLFNVSLFFNNSCRISLRKFLYFLFPVFRKNHSDCQMYCAALPSFSNARYLIFGQNIFEMYSNLHRLGFGKSTQNSFKIMIYIMFLIFFHKSRLVALSNNSIEFGEFSFKSPKILFVGSSGLNNSFVVKHNIEETLCYSKISYSNVNKDRQPEDFWIDKLRCFNFDWKIPEVKNVYQRNNYHVLTTESISETTSKFGGPLVDLLPLLLDLKTTGSTKVLWEEIHQVEYLKKAFSSEKLSTISKSGSKLIQKHSDKEITCGMGHGDFTPWNILLDEHDRLCLIDFEWSHEKSLPGSDLFHFALQKHNCFNGTYPLADENFASYKLFFEQCGLQSSLIMDFLAIHLHYWIAFQVIDAGKEIDHPSLTYFHNFLQEVQTRC